MELEIEGYTEKWVYPFVGYIALFRISSGYMDINLS